MISVIIPVYNAEAFIEQCLASLVKQSFLDFEVLVVNDGSTDHSGDICDRYARDDSRFIVIHQKNAGVSTARNIGISRVKGDYIVFIDSDDWIAPDYLMGLYEDLLVHDADLVDQSFTRIYPDGTTDSEIYEDRYYTQRNIEEWIQIMLGGHTGPFPKIYRASIIRKHRLLFEESLRLCEDLCFTLQYMQYARKGIYFSKTASYYYRQSENSLGMSFHHKEMMIPYRALLCVLEILNSPYYSPLLADRNPPVQLRNKIVQLSMFFMSNFHNGSSRRARARALASLKGYDLDYYWQFISVKNPLRRIFHWAFAKNRLFLALAVEDIRYAVNKRLGR